MMCIVKGFKNYHNSDCVAYHYESQTRNEDPENIKKLNLLNIQIDVFMTPKLVLMCHSLELKNVL